MLPSTFKSCKLQQRSQPPSSLQQGFLRRLLRCYDIVIVLINAIEGRWGGREPA